MASQQIDSAKGAAIYNDLVLHLYDFYVLGLSFSYWWRCPTKTILVPFWRRCFTDNHLDIGVGTGYFPTCAPTLTSESQLTLLDFNAKALNAATERITKTTAAKVDPIRGDAFDLSKYLGGRRFSSVSLFNVFHCLPASPSTKVQILTRLTDYLEDDGVVYGCTILGYGAPHNWLGMLHMKYYNWKGIFTNAEDDVTTFKTALEENYHEVEIEVTGVVLLFRGAKPKRV